MRSRALIVKGAVLAIFAGPVSAFAEKKWEYGGFLETTVQLYPSRPHPSDTHALGIGQMQLWLQASFTPRLSWRTSWELRLDTHGDVDRRRWADLEQRGLRQPAGWLRELYLDFKLGRLDLRLGKQEIRWGRADGFNPTDNLIPYDYINVFSERRIPVPALKVDTYLGGTRLEAAWVPFFTPTRLPLLNQRWFPRLPTSTAGSPIPGEEPVDLPLSYREGDVVFPARTLRNGQFGFRWNHLLPRGEFSVSYFYGFDDLAFFRPTTSVLSSIEPGARVLVTLNREYYRLMVLGADFASEIGPVGVRGEFAFFDQTDPDDADRFLFVIGLDRSWGEWFAIIQYTDRLRKATAPGEVLFPDQGLRSTILYRIERAMGPSRSLEIKGAFRVRDGDFLVQPLYNVALSDKWRLQIGTTLIAGSRSGYLGQYRDSGHLSLQLRYAF